jgi:tetratricopeptide (TPR) repeat protein
MRIHPHDSLLRDFASGALEDYETLLNHLVICEDCRRRLHLLLPSHLVADQQVLEFNRRRDVLADYEPALSRATSRLQGLETAYFRERMGAKLLLSELLAHPAERQILLIRNSPRFQTWGLCELLLKRSREENFHDAVLGEKLAQLALELLEHLDVGYYGAEPLDDLRARAWAYVANSRRIKSDLRGAEEAFALAFAALEGGTGEPVEKAGILDLRASLLQAQHRFHEALRHLRRAVKLFKEAGEKHKAGRSLVKTATLHHFMAEPEKAISLLYKSLDLIDAHREPRLLLVASHNLIDNLAETGQFMQAQKLLVRARPLYQQFPQPWSQNPRNWIEAKIARGLGQQGTAESLLLKARDGFLSAGASYDVAVVSLDLASLYAEQGRFAELKQVAEQIVPIFSSRKIHREAMAALSFWRQAVEAETACLSLVTRVASFLKRARHNLDLRFQETEE